MIRTLGQLRDAFDRLAKEFFLQTDREEREAIVLEIDPILDEAWPLMQLPTLDVMGQQDG